MSDEEEIDLARRLFLQRASLAAGGVGLAATAVPFVSYWLPSVDVEAKAAPIEINIRDLAPRQQLTVPWRGQPIWIIRRTPEMVDDLGQLNAYLRDPYSLEDQQPSYAKNIYRSIKPEYFIAIGICTHLGCVPTYRPDVGSIASDWLGGFYCPCHGSRYDLAGRVYKAVPAPLNLKIPRHQYKNEFEIVIGADEAGIEGAS